MGIVSSVSLLQLLLFVCTGLLADARSSYRAASVMHTPYNLSYGVTVQEIISFNLKQYGVYASTAAQQSADIIVFPESGTGFLQVPLQYLRMFCEPPRPAGWAETNCTDPAAASPTPHQSWASCTAQLRMMDVVINFCLNDTMNGAREQTYYNADVAFWSGGTLQAVYLKSHITGTGPYLSQPTTPDPVTFTSSFGVKFGMFTCYDFWFTQPMLEEMDSMNVSDFLFPSEMGSGNPYFLVPQCQNGWSLSNQVNLVASTSFGNGGAGAYSLGTTLEMVQMHPLNMTDAHGVVVSTVPILASTTRAERLASQRRHAVAASARVRAESVAAATKQDEVESSSRGIVKLPTRSCVYGPPINGLNFSFSCAVIESVAAGTTYLLAADSGSMDSFSRVKCFATVVTRTPSALTWVLGAIALTRPPTVPTPSTNNNGMCVFSQCLNPDTGCMGDNPADAWLTDLGVESIEIEMTVDGELRTNPTIVMPMAGVSNGGYTARAGRGEPSAAEVDSGQSTTTWQLYNLNATELGYVSIPAAGMYSLAASVATSAVLGMQPFYSAGFYATSNHSSLSTPARREPGA